MTKKWLKLSLKYLKTIQKAHKAKIIDDKLKKELFDDYFRGIKIDEIIKNKKLKNEKK